MPIQVHFLFGQLFLLFNKVDSESGANKGDYQKW